MRRLLTLLAALAVATPALAGQAVALRADTSDADGLVTLGDLFEGAGEAAKVPIATRSGPSLVLNARAVQAIAYRAGLEWANAEGIKSIVVRGGEAGAGRTAAGPGAPRGNVEVLTYARSLAAGEVVQPTDLIWGKAAAAPNDAPSDAEQVIGLAAKRPLRAGASVQARDVGTARGVKIGEIVTVTYEADGVSLSLQGKALSAGGVGDPINVQNTQSKKIVQAVVTGPGLAIVGPAAEALKSARPSTRYALR
jgi:flagella basal body P-ring formation protein FlgA